MKRWEMSQNIVGGDRGKTKNMEDKYMKDADIQCPFVIQRIRGGVICVKAVPIADVYMM